MSYLLDANVFIQAKNLHYGLDFCPAFWEWIIQKNRIDQVLSIDKVADEIAAGADELHEWVRENGDGLFLRTTPHIAQQFEPISEWATQQQYEATAINTFFQIADFYLVAHALANNHVLVTLETPSKSRMPVLA